MTWFLEDVMEKLDSVLARIRASKAPNPMEAQGPAMRTLAASAVVWALREYFAAGGLLSDLPKALAEAARLPAAVKQD